jgi:integrase
MQTNFATNFNVIGLNTGSIYQAIEQLFTELKDNKQENTAINYKSHYKEFFMFCCGKNLEQVTWNDLQNITYAKIINFRDYLFHQKQVKRPTVNAKIASIKTLYKHLYKYNKKIDLDVANDVTPLKELQSEKKKSSYGSLTNEEYQALLDYCMTEKYNPLDKKLFFETAITTGNRRSCLLNLKWEDIKQQKDNSGKFFWVIYVYDKGKEVEKPITDEFYNKLCSLKGESAQSTDKIFNICDKIIAKTLRDFCKSADINVKERNIVLHSLKKTSLDMVWEATRDINQTALQGSHKSIQTPYANYLNQNKNYSENPSYYVFTDENRADLMKNASKEEIVKAIQECPAYIQRYIFNALERKEEK